jgi:hypothetical protein
MFRIPAVVIDRECCPGQWTGEEAVRWRRALAGVGAVLVLAGSACERWAVYKAGFQSARDPKYVVAPQRARLAERSGEQVER